MLAKFENGYFLEVLFNEKDNEYEYTVYDQTGEYEDDGWTEYRSIEMYYPMNEIDYILQFCEPDGVEGKYELLECQTMEEYIPSEDVNGKWILETQGNDEEIRRYPTYEATQKVMQIEYERYLKRKESCMENDIQDDFAVIGDEEFYQSWKIYEEKEFDNSIEKKFDEIQKEIDRADIGASQYAFELMSTSVITDHLYKLEKLIDELKELIK